ncbi:MAG: glycosyltransferase family 4 protein, partial [Anaerolineae bacterium]|nr:glycosyltransferase family 4 protein [Anaerolineae bacterium]
MSRPRRIAIVVQRYGEEVNGGAELAARWLAERLQHIVEVSVVTTCAVDYTTWQNVYPPGKCRINGVQVHRFPVDQARDWQKAQQKTRRILLTEHTVFDEIEWMKEQGPYSSLLFKHLVDVYPYYDFFVFFTYLYATTFFGLPLVSDKAILIPTSHDDPYLSLSAFRSLFHLPQALIYLTEPERDLVHQETQNQKRPFFVGGVGVESPPAPSAERFRQRYGIEGDFFLYVGRIHESKNVPELLAFFKRFQNTFTRPLKLVLIGKSHLDLHEDPDIIHLGFLPEQDKYDAIKAATLLIMPSLYESLSIIILEAWLMNVPVLVNGRCEVLKSQCRHSNGGLYYTSYTEFEATLNLLLGSSDLRNKLGEQGHRFVAENYNWETTIAKYQALFSTLLSESP